MPDFLWQFNSIDLSGPKVFFAFGACAHDESLKSECAVGINSHGPEWDQMMKYLRSKNESKFLAGDYSKFDQKLPAQVLFAGLRILIDCARYRDWDIVMMIYVQ